MFNKRLNRVSHNFIVVLVNFNQRIIGENPLRTLRKRPLHVPPVNFLHVRLELLEVVGTKVALGTLVTFVLCVGGEVARKRPALDELLLAVLALDDLGLVEDGVVGGEGVLDEGRTVPAHFPAVLARVNRHVVL